MIRHIRLILTCLLLAGPAFALSPDERLDDPALEARARDLGQSLRCVVCQNETIDASEAPLAQDMRRLVRSRLLAGDSDTEIRDFMVGRYGEFVLMEPPTHGTALLIWLLPPLVLILGLFAVVRFFRAGADADVDIGEEEEP